MLINSMNTTGKMNGESNESSRTTTETIGDEGHTSNVSRHEESSDVLSMDDGQKSVQHRADETNVGQSEVETKDNVRADVSSGQSGKTGKKGTANKNIVLMDVKWKIVTKWCVAVYVLTGITWNV